MGARVAAAMATLVVGLAVTATLYARALDDPGDLPLRGGLELRRASRVPELTAVTGSLISLAASAFVFASLSAFRARSLHRRLLETQHGLAQSEERFRLMAETSPTLVWTTGVDGRCTWVNQSWVRFTGQPREAHLGDAWAAFVCDDDRPRVLAWFSEAQRERRPSQIEYRMRRADGALRWLLVIAVPQADAHGAFSGFLGASVDVHEHHVTEQRLADSELRLRLALKGGELTTWEVDLPTGRLTFSERLVTLLGLSPSPREWTLRQFVDERVHPDDRATIEAVTLSHLEDSAAPFHAELRLRRDDGGWAWVLLSGLVVREQAVPNRIAGTLLDITERKRAEEERRVLLERFARAERAAALGTLASGLAHEINNPLSVALTNSAWLQDALHGPLDVPTRLEAAAALDDVRLALERVRDLVTELGSFTTGASRETSSDLRRVVERARRQVEDVAPPGARLAIELPAGLPPVRGGEGELVQLFAALLLNALQATAERPNIVRVTAVVADGQLRARIDDQGPGMSPEVLRRVFDPFFTTRATGEGRGLGATIAIAIARALGGGVEYERSDEQGTTVLITLPLAR